MRSLEQQADELSALLGRQSGDITTQPPGARAPSSARPSLESLNGNSLAPTPGGSVFGGSEVFAPSDAGSEDGEAAEAVQTAAATGAAADAAAATAAAAEIAAEADADAAEATADEDARLSHPLAEPAPAAASQEAAKSAPVDVPQLRAVMREDRRLSRSGGSGMDSPSRTHFDAAGASVRHFRCLHTLQILKDWHVMNE